MAIYEYKTEIRYSEVDSSGYLSPVALLDLFQNCSTFHSEAIGIGVDYLKERHRAWVLSSWQVHMDNRPRFGTHVTIKTWSYGVKYTLGFRNFTLEDESGCVLCYANTIWAYIDTDTFMPVRCPQDEADKYGINPPYNNESASRKIVLPKKLTACEPFEVKHYFIDTNNHMNNSKYVLAAMEYLPEGYNIADIRVEYKSSAKLHDTIYPFVCIEDTLATIVMKDQAGNIYSTVQFVQK